MYVCICVYTPILVIILSKNKLVYLLSQHLSLYYQNKCSLPSEVYFDLFGGSYGYVLHFGDIVLFRYAPFSYENIIHGSVAGRTSALCMYVCMCVCVNVCMHVLATKHHTRLHRLGQFGHERMSLSECVCVCVCIHTRTYYAYKMNVTHVQLIYTFLVCLCVYIFCAYTHIYVRILVRMHCEDTCIHENTSHDSHIMHMYV
jgi:hypothetical protein